MRAQAQFSDPSDVQVTIVLTGTLKEFEEMSTALLRDQPVPYCQSRTFIEQVSEATRRLRSTVVGEAEGQPL